MMQPRTILISALLITTAFAVFLIWPDNAPVPEFVPVTESDKAIAKAADDMNAKLPLPVDEETMLVKVQPGPNSLTFKHQVLNFLKADTDIAQARLVLEPLVRNGACTSEELASFRDLGATLIYAYYDQEGEFLLSVPVDTTGCE